MYPRHVIVHHSLTKDSKTVSWGAIREYHIKTLGWKDIGYHAGIELIGDEYQIMPGRPWNEEGAHCKEQGMNRQSLGICLVGNFDFAPPPHPQLELAVDLVRLWMKTFGITLDNIHRHSDFATYKSCPGTQFPWQKFLEML